MYHIGMKSQVVKIKLLFYVEMKSQEVKTISCYAVHSKRLGVSKQLVAVAKDIVMDITIIHD